MLMNKKRMDNMMMIKTILPDNFADTTNNQREHKQELNVVEIII
jgi:hypothetical protein